MAMNLLRISPLCVNIEQPSLSLDEQMCEVFLDSHRLVSRSYDREGIHIVLRAPESNEAQEYTFRLYFPEGGHPSVQKSGREARFLIPYGMAVRYCSVVIQRKDKWIVFARSVLLHPRNPLFIDANQVRSPVHVMASELTMLGDIIRLQLDVTFSECKFFLQDSESTEQIQHLKIGTNRIIAEVPKEAIKSQGISMLCCTDGDGLFVAQTCFEAWN